MKIAIFGDSFADDIICWQNQWQDVGPSWIDYLRRYCQVDNFSLGGSCLYYSKKKFDQTNLNLYDRVIFVVTESVRRYQVLKESDNESYRNWNFHSVDTRKANYPGQHVTLETIKNFFVHMHNESDEYFHQLMIDDILRKRSDVMLLNYSDMDNISQTEKIYWVSQGEKFDNLLDARKCHMTEENNLILGEALFDCLKNNQSVRISDLKFVNPTKDFNFYFRKAI